jgi:hypothetical protein
LTGLTGLTGCEKEAGEFLDGINRMEKRRVQATAQRSGLISVKSVKSGEF